MKQVKPNQLDEVLQKGRKILDYFNTNLYESSTGMNINSSPLLLADKNYTNPFTSGKNIKNIDQNVKKIFKSKTLNNIKNDSIGIVKAATVNIINPP